MTVMTPVRSRFFIAIGSSLVMVAGMLFGATAATADSVQVQSYQRASQTATCDSPPESMSEWRASWVNPSDPISGPTWHPSWERWANNGTGGWTCTRSITWARTPIAASSSGGGSVTYAVGDVGPGGGLVFLISGGLTYEMAPKTWGVNETTRVIWTTTAAKCYDVNGGTAIKDCQLNSLYPGTNIVQTTSRSESAAIGMGSANTDTIIARMDAGGVASGAYAAGAARAYPGGGYNDWFLPSRDELNAMCNYSRSWVASPSTGTCTGLQNAGFASSDYGFVTSKEYWSSSERDTDGSWYVGFVGGSQGSEDKEYTLLVRPVRAF